jgi:hypothetical protein
MNFFLEAKKLTIWLHLTAWGLISLIPIYFLFTDIQHNSVFSSQLYITILSFVFIFYINYFFLVPRLFINGKRLWYFLAAMVLIIFIFIINQKLNDFLYSHIKHDREIEEFFAKLNREKRIPKPMAMMPRINFFFSCILLTGFSMGLRVTSQLSQNEKERKELEKEHLNSELAFLKNQISPHFFFNTLNNIYSLIQIDTKDAQQSVLKLSKLMRYLLYESETGNTQLGKEIEFMENYIDLMRLRINDKVQIKTSFPACNLHLQIPPLLFIAFIENAFKHGISNRETSYIFINMEATTTQLRFSCVNSFVQPGATNEVESGSGIGLENIKKRLSLLYPDKHTLTINKTNSSFEVSLMIGLS